MNKKREIKKGIQSNKLMEKIFRKLKMTKHESEDEPSGTASGACSAEIKPFISWEMTKVTPENIMEFSDQLHQFLESVQSFKDVVYCTYELPSRLNTQLEKEAIELRNLFRDVKAAAIDIERLQKQRYLIKKEKCSAAKKLDKLREDEIRELESIICAYAKPLHSKWETIKNSQKVEVLENFMNEVTGKHRAIEILQELIRRKLSKIYKKTSAPPFVIKKNISSTNMNNKNKAQDKNTWNVSGLADIDKFGPTVDKVVRNVADRDMLRVNRRKRQKELREERRRQNADSNTSSSNNAETSGGLDLQLVPIDNFLTEVDEVVPTAKRTTVSTRRAPVVNIELTSDDDSVSMSSTDLAIENLVSGGNQEVHTDLHNEMRSVLQALFGEIRQIPQVGSRNRQNDLRSPRTASN